uniref:AT-rich interactive domain-containing protein 3 n=1 Tax=Coturnix japonica TaxID=93934 RepID=A0A8C2SZT0_COTJA
MLIHAWCITDPSHPCPQLYELDEDPKRKEFLDDLFSFMQKRGTPVNRIPIMAKQVLDLYMLYRLVTEKGGLVEVINKKIWREITKGLNLPTSITSAAFTLLDRQGPRGPRVYRWASILPCYTAQGVMCNVTLPGGLRDTAAVT